VHSNALLILNELSQNNNAERCSELNINLRTSLLCTQAVWPVMRHQGSGKILDFSRAGRVEDSSAMMAAYNCAKAGVDALTRTFAREGGREEGVVAETARERAIAPLNPACVFDIPNQE